MFFGFTLLPAGDFVELTRAVATWRDVHIFLLEPTRLDPRSLLEWSPTPSDGAGRARGNDPTIEVVNHPLLRSWGRLHRETALLLADGESDRPPVERIDQPVDAPTTLLGRLQHDIRANVAPVASLVPGPTDRSVQFHACYGDTRQVEVLRDALLHLVAAPGSDLTEDDIVVLCPSLQRFAPLIEAVFGRSAEPVDPSSGNPLRPDGTDPAVNSHRAPALRYRIADQSIRAGNPVLGAASTLLELVAGRFDVASVLEFLSLAPVRQRLGFDDEQLGVITEWMEATNVRWGLDADHRDRLGLPASIATNTWQAAIDRLLIGSTVYEESLRLSVGEVAPFGVEGGDVEVAGALAEALGHLAELAGETASSHTLAAWIDHITRACSALFATPRDVAWQTEALERVLFAVIDTASVDGTTSDVPLTFADVRRVVGERLDDTVGRADFFRGGITITSMTPLRWVPFRAVCLLGVDQAAFGSETSAGDDLTAAMPQVGDRDSRGEAREALLEAVLAAGEALVVVRNGRDVMTNQVIPRSVVASELFDAVVASVDAADRPVVASRLEIDHPRQAYDERCFEHGGLVDNVVWGFDRGALDGAMARRAQTSVRAPFLTTPLAPVDGDVIELADLHTFFNGPVGAFFTQRLQARLPRVEDELPRVLPTELGGLERWKVGNRLLEARLDGFTSDEWLRYERALGTLPPGALGTDAIAALEDDVDKLVQAATQLGMGPDPAQSAVVDAHLADGSRVVGSVPLRLDPSAPGPIRLYYSRFKAAHRIGAWLDLIALLNTDPDTPWRSVAISRPENASRDAFVTDLVAAPSTLANQAGPTEALEVAVDCYRRGMCEPIPLFPSFSFDLYNNKSGTWQAQGFGPPGEGDALAVRLAFGDRDRLAITEMPARPGDPTGPYGRVWRYATYLYRTIARSTAAGPSASSASGAKR